MYVGSLNEVMYLDENKNFRKLGNILKHSNTGSLLGGAAAAGYETYKDIKNPLRIFDPVAGLERNRNIAIASGIGGAIGAGKGIYGAIKAGNKDKDVWDKKDSTSTKIKKGAKFAGRGLINMTGENLGAALGAGAGAGIGTLGGAPGMIGGSLGGSYLGSKYGRKAGEYISDKIFGKEK